MSPQKYSQYVWRMLLSCITVLLVLSCRNTDKETLPPASGAPGSIYIVMDPTQWKAPLGRTIDSLFSVEVQGLPRPEPLFDVQWIDPTKLNFILKRHRNLIIVLTFNNATVAAHKIKNLFSRASLKKALQKPKKYATAAEDIYAKNQGILYLYGKTEEELAANIRRKGRQLVEYFEQREQEHLHASLFKAGRLKGISKWLHKNLRCDIDVPINYKLAETGGDFLWARLINLKNDKNIFVTRTRYTSPGQLEKKELITLRDRVCKKHLFEDPEHPDSYLITETTVPFIPVSTKKLKLNGRYAVKMTGLWRANNFSMGGPFIAYAVVDRTNGYLYYIEGFVFSPGEDQRELIRQLDAILNTFSVDGKI